MEVDNESKLDEIELSNLQKAISKVETALAVSAPGSRAFFENFLSNATARVIALEKRIKDTETRQQEAAESEIVLAELARKETALNDAEKETYSGFLMKEFFTKKDFDRLEQFYSHTWNRLSEDGKQMMSIRIWEGIRRDEYTFSELPKTVQEKEEDRAYTVLKKRETGVGSEFNIPTEDREDFIRAYESGERQRASKVLERESFKATMFRAADTGKIGHAAVEQGRDADRSKVEETIDSMSASKNVSHTIPKSGGQADLDLSGLNLDGVKLTQAEEISVSAIPTAISPSKSKPSLSGC